MWGGGGVYLCKKDWLELYCKAVAYLLMANDRLSLFLATPQPFEPQNTGTPRHLGKLSLLILKSSGLFPVLRYAGFFFPLTVKLDGEII